MTLDHAPIHPGSRLDTIRRPVVSHPSRGKLACAIVALFLSTSCQNRDIEAQAEAGKAMQMLDQNRIAEARMAINSALMLRDDVVDYHLARGRIELAAGATSAAFDAYYDALALDGNNLEALQAVSRLGLQTGNVRESLKATDTLVVLDPGSTSALVTRGLHSLIASRVDEAADYAAKALAVDPFNDEALILKSRVLYLKGRNEDALNLLGGYSADREPSVGIFLMRLELYRAERDPKGMAAQFAALRSKNFSNWQLTTDEANYLFKVGKREDAVNLTTKLLVAPDLPREALPEVMALWDIWGLTDLPPQAVSALAQQGQDFVRYAIGLYLVQHSSLQTAKQFTVSLKGNDRNALNAFMLYRSGNIASASRLAEDILSKDSSHCLALEVSARTNLAEGKLRAALSRAQQLGAQCPRERAGWTVAAAAYTGLGDPDNAERALQQGAEANPQDFSFAREQTQWLNQQGKTREALAVSRRLTRTAPAMTRAWELYRQLCADSANPCQEEAERGRRDALTRFWIDYKPGETPPPGLYGRLKEI